MTILSEHVEDGVKMKDALEIIMREYPIEDSSSLLYEHSWDIVPILVQSSKHAICKDIATTIVKEIMAINPREFMILLHQQLYGCTMASQLAFTLIMTSECILMIKEKYQDEAISNTAEMMRSYVLHSRNTPAVDVIVDEEGVDNSATGVPLSISSEEILKTVHHCCDILIKRQYGSHITMHSIVSHSLWSIRSIIAYMLLQSMEFAANASLNEFDFTTQAINAVGLLYRNGIPLQEILEISTRHPNLKSEIVNKWSAIGIATCVYIVIVKGEFTNWMPTVTSERHRLVLLLPTISTLLQTNVFFSSSSSLWLLKSSLKVVEEGSIILRRKGEENTYLAIISMQILQSLIMVCITTSEAAKRSQKWKL